MGLISGMCLTMRKEPDFMRFMVILLIWLHKKLNRQNIEKALGVQDWG